MKVALILLFAFWTAFPACTAENFKSAYITEFLALNQKGLKDQDGERAGWLELYNGSTMSVDLNGWWLTDTATNLTKWRFPAVSLLPDKYLMVFASGKDHTNALGQLHTNFRLPKGGGYLALVNPKTNIISEFSFKKQSADVSYGRVRGEPGLHGPFQRPSPGKPNPVQGNGFAPEVTFSCPSGTFVTPFSLALSCPSKDATIHYTVDCSPPTSRSPVYTTPLLMTNSSQVRARAFTAGRFPGPVRSEAYVLLHTNALSFSSTLPVLVLDTFGRDLPTSSRNSAIHVSLFEPTRGKTALTNHPTLVTRASHRIRGSTSSGMPQSPFAIEFIDEYNQEKDLGLLGLPPDSDWILYAPNTVDPVMIHNPFVHQLSRDMGRYSPRTRFVEVFVVNDAGSVKPAHYNGLYVLEEKIKISKHRVNIDRLGPEDLKPPAVTGGYLLKFDRLGPGEVGLISSGDRGMVYVEPREQVLSLPQRSPQKEYVDRFFDDFHRALYGRNWKSPTAGYRAYLDVDAAIDFHVLEVLSGNVDALVLSTYFHKPRNGKVICGPHWDFDRALGSTDGRDENPRQWVMGHPYFEGAWWSRLFQDPDFWQLWVDRWQELRQSHFSLTNLFRLTDQLAAEVRAAHPRQYQRWSIQPRGGSFETEIEHMKRWLSNRVDFIDQQLVPAPRFSIQKKADVALLTLAASTNTIVFYSLDGTDPRLPQGTVSSNAIRYTTPVSLKSNTRLKARSWNTNQVQSGGPPVSTPWSRPVSAP